MPLPIPLPYTKVFHSGYYNSTDTTTGVAVNSVTDARSPLVKTAAGKWRPPTNYSRRVDWGNVTAAEVVARCDYVASGYPPTQKYWATYNGGCDFKGGYGATVPSFPSNLTSNVILKARLKLKAQKVSLGIGFGERAQTARLCVDTLTRLYRAAHAARRLNWNETLWALGLKTSRNQRRFESAIELWLEAQYGWKPLYSDVWGSIHTLQDREKESNRLTVTVKASTGDNLVSTKTLSDDLGTEYMQMTQLTQTKQRAHIRLDFERDANPAQSTLSQLGLTNPLEIAWELVPFSFVADWWIPVGDYLSSLDATLGWHFLAGSLSTKTTVDLSVYDGKVVKNGSYTGVGSTEDLTGTCYSNSKGRMMQFNRLAYTVAPTPDRPFMSLGASNYHVANGIALFAAAIAGMKGKVR